ncbi:MAG: winged helix DNA-binding domain-containing protein, partial [Chloroflexi bacterium]|nr:winged helix DNA-binding domain-containing protein [Chloroflexota bacterium]
MAISLSDQEIRWLRLRAQRLYPKPSSPHNSVVRTVIALCAVQAQYPQAAALALRPRTSGFVAADIDRARLSDRSLVRTWCMRGTLHLLPTQDVSWLLALHGPVFAAAGRRRRRQLGLDGEFSAKGLEALGEILSGGKPRT